MFSPQIKHLAPFGCRNEGGCYLAIDSKFWVRSVETAKFFLALHCQGLPVVLADASPLLACFRGIDKIGIVPDSIIPRYCEFWFSGESIAAFMNLPCESPDCEALLPHVHWILLENLCLKPDLKSSPQ